MHWRRLRPCPSPCNPAYEIGRCEGRSIDKWQDHRLGFIKPFQTSETLLGNRAMAHSALVPSQVQETVHYIEQQLEHHRTRTFQEEYLAFLKKHGAHFDEKYLWD
jgi:hypothetical protein